MSIVDPSQQRLARESSYRGSTLALVWTYIGAILLLVAGAVAGLAVSQVVVVFRMSELNSVFSDSPDQHVSGWVVPVAIVGTIVAGSVYTRWNHRWSGRTPDFAGVGPVTPWLIGAAACLWWSTTALWPAPDRVGVAVDPTFGNDSNWGASEWTWYMARWWLPGVVTVLAVLALVVGAFARRKRNMRRVLVKELLRTGQRTTGEVTAVSGVTTGNAKLTALTWTFSFIDAGGIRRWVERTSLFQHGAAPITGAQVSVLFNPTRPEDTDQIFVALHAGDTADDYLQFGA